MSEQGDAKSPAAKTEEAPQGGAPDDADAIHQGADGPISLSTLRSDRNWASAGYFATCVGGFILIPALAYAWRGRHSRFVGFHAVQAVLLQVVSLPYLFIVTNVSSALDGFLRSATTHGRGAESPALIAATSVAALVFGLLFMAPIVATVWLGICALRGKPQALPILGRWAKTVVRDANKP